MRRDVVERLKEIAPTVLRWPGGNFAGDYRWLDGLLDADKRAPLAAFMEIETLPHSRGVDHHEIDTDSFLALCGEIGAEPFLTINLAWDSPETSAAWVEYCNGSARSKWGRLRARRGHRQPYRVRFWSLGNELGYTHMEGPNAPSAYAKKAAACARAMRRVDPSLVLACSGFWWNDAWYRDCLKPLSPQIQLFAHHYYTKPVPTKYAGPGSAAQFRKIVTKPAWVLDDLRKIRAKADASTGPRNQVAMSFDEWNVWYAWNRKPGVVDGIHAAAMLNMFCREAAALAIPMCCYFEPVNEGAILVDPAGSRLTPVGQAFALFKPHRRRTLLKLDGATGDVDAAASLDERTGEVVVTLVNLSPERDREVTLRIAGVEDARGEVVLLSSRDFLPASRFVERRRTAKTQNGRMTVSLPRHSVTRVSLATGRRSR
jgi:alpha-N-arabinofuranosidase